jgi:hypothetical protein
VAKKIHISDDDIRDIISPELDRAKDWQTQLSDERRRCRELYDMMPLGNEVDGFSQTVESTVFEVVEWLKPGLADIFTHEDFFTVKMKNADQADRIKDIVRHQLFTQQEGPRIVRDYLDSALKYHFSVLKVCYAEEFDEVEEEYERLSLEEAQMLENAGADFAKYDEVQGVDAMGQPVMWLENVKVIRKEMKFRGPKVMPVPPWEFFISPGAKSIDEARVVAHCVPRTLHDIKVGENSGIYKKGSFAKLRDKAGEARELPEYTDEKSHIYEQDNLSIDEVVTNSSDVTAAHKSAIPSRRIDVWEVYTSLDIDNDGLLEPVIVRMAEDEILAIEENPYKRPPFRAGRLIEISHRFEGRALPLVLEDDQKELTNLSRLFVDSAAESAYATAVTNDQGFMQQWAQRAIGDCLFVQGNPSDKVHFERSPAADPNVLKAIELKEGKVERKSGVSRYNQGIDADSLNKMLCIHTPVPLADGDYIPLGQVEDGDRIIGADGKAVTVVKAHEIHNPERAYRIVFASGEEIFAGGEHLWTVQTECDKRLGKSRTIDTDTMYAWKNKFSDNMYIPRVQRPEIENPETPPIDPYILGVWLGDGHSWSPRITTMDEHVVNRLKKWAADNGCEVSATKNQNSGKATTYYIKGCGFYSKMRALNLIRRGREDDYSVIGKHIPEAYFHASYADRLELLRGLMDTDGCHHSGALCVFSQKDGRLLGDVTRLIESLGGWWNESTVDAGVLAKEGQKYVNITFHIFDNPFSLPAKADKWRAPMRNTTTQPIITIEPVDIRPMRCLTVDAEDGLFCVGRKFTVTHNTATGISIISSAGQQRQKFGARILGEPLAHVIRDMIRINKMWPPYLEDADLQPEPGLFDSQLSIEIEVGVGPQDRMAQSQFLSQHQMWLTGFAIPQGLAGPEHSIKCQAKIGKLQGVPFDDLMRSPEELDGVKQLQQQIQQMGQQLEQVGQQTQEMQQFVQKLQQEKAQLEMKASAKSPEIEQMKLQADMQVERAKIEADMTIEREKMAMDAQLKREQMQLDAQMEAMRPVVQPQQEI